MNVEDLAIEQAIKIAEYGRYTTTPNPCVGAVIIKDGEIVSKGFHYQAGLAHAEINAINDAEKKGIILQCATMVVTLEPCCHFGKTPPCTQSIIAKGFAKVIVLSVDINPKVAGRGIQELINSGINVVIVNNYYQAKAHKINRGFFLRQKESRAWINLKMALFPNGATNIAKNINNGKITNELSRSDIQYWRARACAIITGINTVLVDNPQLNVRSPPKLFPEQDLTSPRQPLKVILDGNNRLVEKTNLEIFNYGNILHIGKNNLSENKKINKHNYRYLALPTNLQNPNFIDLSAVVSYLNNLPANDIMLECGATLAKSFWNNNLIDQLSLYYAPNNHHGANGIFTDLAIKNILKNPNWKLEDKKYFGEDVRYVFIKNEK